MCHRGLPKSIKEGLDSLVKIEERSFKEMIILLGNNISSEKGFILPPDELFINFAKENNITIPEIMNIIACVVETMVVKSDGDTIEDLLDDLIEIGKLDKANKNSLISKIKIAEQYFINKIEHYAQEQAIIKSSFPILDDFKTRIILLNDYGESFNAKKDTPEEHEVKLTNRVPLVIIRFMVDKFGEKIVEQFAVTENGIDQLINHMMLAKKELLDSKNQIIKQ